MDNDWLEKYENRHAVPTKRENNDKIYSTSYCEIDHALGIGGFPTGKVIDIAGEPGIGKSAFIYDFISYCQKEHPELAFVYLDLDGKFDTDYAAQHFVKLDDLLIFRPESIDTIVPACESLMKEGLADYIIFDSISNLNLEGRTLKSILNPLLQKIVEYKSTLILLSQIRADLINQGITTPKNITLDDVSNIRIMLKFLSTLKHQEVVIGHKIEVDIYKNELASPAKTNIELFV